MVKHMNDKPIIIIGAGISGLTLCLILIKNGYPAILFEKEKEIDQPGAGINISPNGSAVLFQLGIKEKIITIADKPNTIELKTYKKGLTISKQNLNDDSERLFNYPYLQMQRKDIINILMEEINNISPNIIRTNHSFESYTENKQSVLAHFNNQRSFEGSIVVGCDGINSAVRKIILPNSENKFSGIIAWRGLVDMDKLSKKTQNLSSTVWMGKNSHFVHYPIKKSKFINFIGTLRKDKWENNSWHQTGDKEELKKDFIDWNGTVKEIIDNTDVIYKWGLFENKSLPNWTTKRSVIIGDAAHPMSPSYGQGANTAIEDAIILYRSILCFKNDTDSALKKFQKNRKLRTEKIQKASKLNTRLFHLNNPILRVIIYSGIYIISRLVPFILIKSSWIYKYNAFKIKLK